MPEMRKCITGDEQTIFECEYIDKIKNDAINNHNND